ncbi:HlyD family type I secretion periplasmic adaptor subunit [Halovulum sp. GXIMD14793]
MSTPRRYRAGQPLWIGFVTLLILIFGIGTWSALAHIAGAIIAPGQIMVEGNRQAVQHAQGGTVGEILVQDGDHVASGDLLLRLDDKLLRSELAIIEGQLFEILARSARLKAERDGADEVDFGEDLKAEKVNYPEIESLMAGQANLFAARRESMARESEQLAEKKIQVGKQIEGAEAQLAALQEQLGFIDQELADQRTLLEKGLTQMARVLSLEREKSRLNGQVGGLIADVARLRGQVSEIEIEILKLRTGLREEAITQLRDLQYREIELREKRLSAQETLSRLEVRAPVAGVIYGRQINTVGAVIRPADVLMFVVPQDIPLVISSRIETIHVDQVSIGQEAILRFSSFDQRTTPELTGTVVRVSADAIVDEKTGVTFYEAEVIPNEGELDKLEGLTLIPGMPVEAYIQTGDRTPLAYLVKPLADYFNRAFRES